MRVFVDPEARRFEVGSLVHESAILCAEPDMLHHRHIESAAVNEGASRLLATCRSLTRIEEHGSAAGEHKRSRDLYLGHFEGRKFHDGGTSCGVNVHRYRCDAAASHKPPEFVALLMMPESVVSLLKNPEP